MFGVLSRITHIYKQNLFNPALRDQISSTKVPRLIYEIRSDPITRIFRKLSFTMMKDDLLIRQIEDHSVINISSCLIHTIPTFKWWTFYSENSDSCAAGKKRKKSYTTATSYRRATWPRFRRNKLICAYIYIYLNGGVRVSDLYERGSQLIAPPTNVIEASLARMEISLGYIASSIDLLTHRTLRRVTPSYTYIHTHTVPRKMHAMREIFLRYLKIVRVLQGRSLGIRFMGFLFEVFRLKKKSESSAQSMGIFSFIDREKRIWVR